MTYVATLPPGTLNLATATIQLELRMESDGGWSDEDGSWETPCGPFGTDDLAIGVGLVAETFDFDDGPQGWSFARCEGVGTFMSVVPEPVWIQESFIIVISVCVISA